jgi:hypothetical protein
MSCPIHTAFKLTLAFSRVARAMSDGWITLHASDGSFRVNCSRWPAMTLTRLPELLERKGWLFDHGIAVSESGGIRLNLTAAVVQPLVEALQQMHMYSAGLRCMLALPEPLIVETRHASAIWDAVNALGLMPYLKHACMMCSGARASVYTQLCYRNKLNPT